MPDSLAQLHAASARHHRRLSLLDAASAAEAHLRQLLEPPPPAGFWARVRRRFGPPLPATGQDSAADHAEVLASARALSFHRAALEAAADELAQDRQAVAAWGADASVLGVEARALARILDAEDAVMKAVVDGLADLHTAAVDLAHALSRQRLQGHGGPVELAGVVRRVVEQATELHHRVDTLEEKLRALDAEAAARRAAAREVAGWLGDTDDA